MTSLNKPSKQSFSLDNFFANLTFKIRLAIWGKLFKDSFFSYILLYAPFLLLTALISLVYTKLDYQSNVLLIALILIFFYIIIFVFAVIGLYFFMFFLLRYIYGNPSKITLAFLKEVFPNFKKFILYLFLFLIITNIIFNNLYSIVILFFPTDAYNIQIVVSSLFTAVSFSFKLIFLYSLILYLNLNIIALIKYIFTIILKNFELFLSLILIAFLFILLSNFLYSYFVPEIKEMNMQMISLTEKFNQDISQKQDLSLINNYFIQLIDIVINILKNTFLLRLISLICDFPVVIYAVIIFKELDSRFKLFKSETVNS